MSILVLILLLTYKMGLPNATGHAPEHSPAFYTLAATRLKREGNRIQKSMQAMQPRHNFNIALLQLMDKWKTNPRSAANAMDAARKSGAQMDAIQAEANANTAEYAQLREITQNNKAYAMLEETIDFVHSQAHRPAAIRPFYNLAFLIKNRRNIKCR